MIQTYSITKPSWVGLGFRTLLGGEKVMCCLFVHHAFEWPFERHFAINTLEYGNDLGIVGYPRVPTFNFVSATLGRAKADRQNDKVEKTAEFWIFHPSRVTNELITM